jgi:hypothetical protein
MIVPVRRESRQRNWLSRAVILLRLRLQLRLQLVRIELDDGPRFRRSPAALRQHTALKRRRVGGATLRFHGADIGVGRSQRASSRTRR